MRNALLPVLLLSFVPQQLEPCVCNLSVRAQECGASAAFGDAVSRFWSQAAGYCTFVQIRFYSDASRSCHHGRMVRNGWKAKLNNLEEYLQFTVRRSIVGDRHFNSAERLPCDLPNVPSKIHASLDGLAPARELRSLLRHSQHHLDAIDGRLVCLWLCVSGLRSSMSET